jgi:pyroglutamyl-peptidase
MNKILITGFEPFGGETVNPALQAVKMLDGQIVGECIIVARSLPVVWRRSVAKLNEYIDELDPVAVITVGQAGGRPDITPERVAINVDDYRIQDNDGFQPIDEPVVQGAPAAYFSTLPIKTIVARLREKGIPASVSNTAGTFVCNHLFYGLMHRLATEGNKRRGGFIHIPYSPEQAANHPGAPSMAVEVIAGGLLEAALVTATTVVDSKDSGGTIC